jgi:type III secretion protein J
MDGVVSARVHVAMPERDPLSDVPRPPSAAVYVRYDPESDVASQTSAIQSLVASGVEGLSRDRVTVVTTPAVPLAQIRPAPAASPPLTPYLAVAGGLAGLAGWWLLRRRARGGLVLR